MMRQVDSLVASWKTEEDFDVVIKPPLVSVAGAVGMVSAAQRGLGDAIKGQLGMFFCPWRVMKRLVLFSVYTLLYIYI